MPETTVTKRKNSPESTQYITTVPKGLAEAFDLEEKKLDWSVSSGNKFEVSIVEGDDE